ncbi:unnamed protein product [Cylicocyclus nassatus]|uniref:Uncharacterized protein n=1 Tax=Cylicocyclus nassatus TaxID=53992 RepID=A0AA36GMR9_CYLNA|nr:unnamed protein product [Cylicocyclus nassatus]
MLPTKLDSSIQFLASATTRRAVVVCHHQEEECEDVRAHFCTAEGRDGKVLSLVDPLLSEDDNPAVLPSDEVGVVTVVVHEVLVEKDKLHLDIHFDIRLRS